MKKPTVLELKRSKGAHLAMLTAYDFPTARLVAEAGVDLILVGDSLGMVVLGYDSTVPVTLDEMVHHTRAARRGAAEAFLIADMPFLSYATPDQALATAARLMKDAGADAVKLEGGVEVARVVARRSGIPTIGIGAGCELDVLVLVLHDVVGLFSGFTPTFVKRYAEAGETIREALKCYAGEVRTGAFPAREQSFTINGEVLKRLYGT